MSEFAPYAPSPPESGEGPRIDGLIVRPAVEADLDEVAEIAATREGEEVERWRGRMRRLYEENRAGRRAMLLVAAAPARAGVVGYGKANLVSIPADAPSNAAPSGWYLAGLVVRPEFRRRGVGSELTRARLARIAAGSREAYYFANARNAATIDLHRAFGFIELTRDFWFPGAAFDGGAGVLFRRLEAGPADEGREEATEWR